jgi:hypothetical protein
MILIVSVLTSSHATIHLLPSTPTSPRRRGVVGLRNPGRRRAWRSSTLSTAGTSHRQMVAYPGLPSDPEDDDGW